MGRTAATLVMAKGWAVRAGDSMTLLKAGASASATMEEAYVKLLQEEMAMKPGVKAELTRNLLESVAGEIGMVLKGQPPATMATPPVMVAKEVQVVQVKKRQARTARDAAGAMVVSRAKEERKLGGLQALVAMG